MSVISYFHNELIIIAIENNKDIKNVLKEIRFSSGSKSRGLDTEFTFLRFFSKGIYARTKNHVYQVKLTPNPYVFNKMTAVRIKKKWYCLAFSNPIFTTNVFLFIAASLCISLILFILRTAVLKSPIAAAGKPTFKSKLCA